MENRDSACMNIVPRIGSLFWWHSKLDSAQESLLIIKAKASLLDGVVTVAKEIHSYDTPGITALPIIRGNLDYLEWTGEEVRQSET
jgi:periplasmic divalent cation tolerance protein